jgi:hypothetical protein
MTQKIDPFVQLNWGWDDGENGWGSGMNENLIVSAFFHNRRLNDILADGSMLPPSPVDGSAYFVNSDKNVYIRAEGQWYNTLPPVGMTFVKKTDESVVKFNGTTLVADSRPISEVTGLQAALDAKVDDSQVGAINGVAPLGVDGKVPAINLPLSDSYLGTWNATTNTPTIVSSTGTQGQYYEVTVGGSTTIDGISSWAIGDKIKFNGTVWQKIPNTSAVSSVNGQTGAVVLTNTDVGAAATSHTHSNATTSVAGFMSNTDKTKLDGISAGATVNSSDATLLSRVNHTGTQTASTISDLTETVQDIVGAQIVAGSNVTAVYDDGAGTVTISATSSGGASSALGLSDVPDSYSGQGLKFWRNNAAENAVEWVSLGTAAFNNTGDFANSSHTHSNATTSVSGFMSNTDKTKLDGIASGATVNSSDATLLNRANHTGSQAQSTVTNLVTDLAAKAPLAAPTFTGTVTLPSTTSIGTVSSTEIGYLGGVTSSLQTQLNNKQPLATVLTNTTASFTTTLESKLNGIAAGAEVNVNADWNAVSGDAQILNKPSFAAIATSGSASDLLTGTVSDTRLPSTMSGKTFTSDLTIDKTSGQASLYLKQAGGTNGRIYAVGGAGTDISIDAGRFIQLFPTNYTITSKDIRIDTTSEMSKVFVGNTSGGAGVFPHFESLGTRADGNTSFQGRIGLAFRRTDGTAIQGGAALGMVAFGGQHGNSSSNIDVNRLYAASIQGVSEGVFNSNTDMPTAIVFKTGVSGNDLSTPNSPYGTERARITASGNFLIGTSSDSGYKLRVNGSSYFDGSVTLGGGISGDGSGLGALNASNLSSGTVPTARLPASSTSVAGIVQLGDGSTVSSSKAATEAWVYGIAAGLGSLGGLVVYQDKPQQLFQSLGTVSGSVTVNSGSGIHVLATVNGNTTWTFPTPTNSSQVLALTLELTNGGAYTMTWPAGTRWAGGIAPTLTASGTDILVFTKAGTNNWRGYLSSKDNK